MPKGKLASQAIHAARLSMLHYLNNMDEHKLRDAIRYFIHINSCGSAIGITAKNLAALENAKNQAIEAGLPWALFSDSGHILPPHFDGNAVVTGLAIGPARREDMRHITKKFQIIKG